MKVVKITMELVVDEVSPADNWIYSSIADQLEDGEGILDWRYEVIKRGVEPLEMIETFNKAG